MLRKYNVGLLALAVAFGAVAFTAPKHEKKAYNTYFFRYTPTSPGQEASASAWQYVTSGFPSCGATNDGCLIEVKDTYTAPDATLGRVLTAAVPVISSGGHLNPDVSSDMIENASNKN